MYDICSIVQFSVREKERKREREKERERERKRERERERDEGFLSKLSRNQTVQKASFAEPKFRQNGPLHLPSISYKVGTCSLSALVDKCSRSTRKM